MTPQGEPSFIKGLRLILLDEATPADLYNVIVDHMQETVMSAGKDDELAATEYHRALLRLAAKKEE